MHAVGSHDRWFIHRGSLNRVLEEPRELRWGFSWLRTNLVLSVLLTDSESVCSTKKFVKPKVLQCFQLIRSLLHLSHRYVIDSQKNSHYHLTISCHLSRSSWLRLLTNHDDVLRTVGVESVFAFLYGLSEPNKCMEKGLSYKPVSKWCRSYPILGYDV